ncbi:thiamine pyrophosphate-dependent dehydrogenase E1 component subunit alpha [bacterium]|nr:MAG: thiamine pyrophosphate-dependent dehydrogenase E1 component subunit alpha [bacterium]
MLNLELYRKLYTVRKTEECIREHYAENEMKTPMHMSMGEEAIAVGVCHALKKEDQVFGTYRSHAIYLAKTLDTDDFFAEMYGKDTALLKGKGGSMHLFASEFGFMVTSAIVASNIPVAIGAAFANKQKRNGKLVAVFFGDGALGEGNFWESLNVACLMELPVLFICEDNDLAIHTPARERQGFNSIAKIAAKFNCNVLKSDSTDAEIIYKLTRRAIKLIRDTKMPSVLYLKYYRYLEHVGVNEDFDAGYRSKSEFEKWFKNDPVSLQRAKLLRRGFKKQVLGIEKRVEKQIENSLRLAKAAPFAEIKELYRGVFA